MDDIVINRSHELDSDTDENEFENPQVNLMNRRYKRYRGDAKSEKEHTGGSAMNQHQIPVLTAKCNHNGCSIFPGFFPKALILQSHKDTCPSKCKQHAISK